MRRSSFSTRAIACFMAFSLAGALTSGGCSWGGGAPTPAPISPTPVFVAPAPTPLPPLKIVTSIVKRGGYPIEGGYIRMDGGNFPQESSRDADIYRMAPALLLHQSRKHPIAKYPKMVFAVTFGRTVDGADGLLTEITYNRAKGRLSDVTSGPGGGHGVNFFGVTDQKLAALALAAKSESPGHVRNIFARLQHMGCRVVPTQ